VSAARATLLAVLALAACRTVEPGAAQPIVIPPSTPSTSVPPEPPAPRPADEAKPIELGMSWGEMCARVGGRVHCVKLGYPEDLPISAVPPLGGIEDAVSLAVGYDFVCLATARGTVHCTGENHFGQLGARLRDERRNDLVQVANVAGATRVIAGRSHACALLATGRAVCWGRNDRGQTGGSVTYAAEARELVEPVEVPSVTAIASLAASSSTTCAATEAHDLWCWGDHPPARLAEAAGVADLSAAETALCGVKEGAVECWGYLGPMLSTHEPRPDVVKVPTPRPARRVRLGNSHGCALLHDGAVACFGASYSHALGHGVEAGTTGARPARIVEGLPRAIDVAAGPATSCAVTVDHEVYCWGSVPKKIRISG
jgi:alpha-tubulin suppressor-like RCC1 family protein